ncbi:MAG: porin family protein [Bacteroidota bacterium]
MDRKRLSAILSISCLILFSFGLGAQAQSTVSLGFQAGLNLADASTSPNFGEISTRMGLMVGGYLEISLSDVFSIQPELFEIQKGAESSVRTESGPSIIKWNFEYAELPILVKVKLGLNQVRAFVFAGPNIGIKTQAESEVTLGTRSQTNDIKDQIKSTEISFDFGIGGEVRIDSTVALTTSIRYSHGLTDINKDTMVSWRSYGIQVVLGAEFSL